MKFLCRNCDKIFDAEAVRKEYTDPIYGPCSKNVTNCPDCKTECSEYVKPKPQKASSQPVMPSCATGSCSGCPSMNQ